MSTSIQVEDLKANQTYFFTVTAYNTANLESDPSNVVAYTVPDSPDTEPAPIVLRALDGTVQTLEDAAVALSLRAEISSGDTTTEASRNTPLTYQVTTPPSFGSLEGSGPDLTYRPAANFAGTDSFQFIVSDGVRTSNTGTFQISVAPVNDAPVALAQTLSTFPGATVSIALKGTDVEGSPLSYAIVRGVSHGTLSGSGATRTYTAPAGFVGTDSFEFAVSDGQAVSAPATVTIQVQGGNNSAPIANPMPVSVKQGGIVFIKLTGSDPDGNPISFKVTRPPSNGSLSGGSPNHNYVPVATFSGTDSFEFTVSDGKLTSAPATVTITVLGANGAPVAHPQSLALDQGTSIPVKLAGSDPDNNPITYAVSRAPANGTLTGTAPNLTYTPAVGFSGSDSFDFTVNDGSLTSPAARVSITVNPVNRAPVAIAQNLTLPQGGSLPITLTGSDPDKDPLSFSVTKPPTGGTLSGTPPSVTYTPAKEFSGTDSFEFRASDGKATSATAVVTLTVTPSANQPPKAEPATFTTNEDSSIYLTVTANDPEGAPLSYEIVSQPTRGELLGSGPRYRYVPSMNTNGVDTFRFVVSDGSLSSQPATVTININPINDAPRATSQSVRLNEDTPTVLTLGGTDIDGDTLRVVITRQPTNGTLSGTGPQFTYTPKADYFGSDSIAFKVNDGTVDSAEAVVSLMISAVNDTPVAFAQSVSTTSDTPVSIVLAGSDVESTNLLYRISRQPSKGTLTGSAPNLTYKPSTGFTGSDSFEFTVYDGALTSTPATVAISVSQSAPTPVPTPDIVFVGTAGSTTTLLGGATSVLANDHAPANTTVQLHQGPRHGTVTLANDGSFKYHHAGGTETEDEFWYVANAGGASSTATRVQVHVFQLIDIARQGGNALITFPMIQEVNYSVEGNDVVQGTATGWQVLGTYDTDVAFVAQIPVAADADGSARFFRIRATHANGTLVTEVFGFQRFPTQAGVQSYASPFHGARAALSTVATASGSTVTLASSSLPANAWNPAGPMPTHALIVRDTTQWWPILGNTSQTVTVDPRGSNLSTALTPGAQVEVVRLATALEILGAPGTADSAISVGDFVDFVTGNGTVATIECRTTAGVPAYHLSQSGTSLGAVNPSSITFLPGQPIQVQKAGAIGTLWFLGRVQSNPLTIDTVSANGTNGGVIE